MKDIEDALKAIKEKIEMELRLVKVSVVVLSAGNNPRLLNPDFLERNKIVPADWKIADVLVTPPFAQVIYENGIQFIVEIEKLQIQANRPDAVEWDTWLPGMATEYLELLPHVTYRSVGLNFVFIAGTYPSEPFTKLLKEGPWLEKEGGMTGAAIELQYRSVSPQMNAKIEIQQPISPDQDARERLAFTVNYHQDFDAGDSTGRKHFIRSIGSLKNRFVDFAETLPFNKQEG